MLLGTIPSTREVWEERLPVKTEAKKFLSTSPFSSSFVTSLPVVFISSSCPLAFLTPYLHNRAASLYSLQDTCLCFHCLCSSFLPFSLTSRSRLSRASLLPSFPDFLHLVTLFQKLCIPGFEAFQRFYRQEGGDSSHSSPAPAWGPSHGRQSSMNCSNVGPFHEVQSFRNRLLQRGSPTGSQVLPANLLQRGILSPWIHRSCQRPALAWASHGVTASFGIHLLWCGVLHGLQVDICSTINPMGCRGTSLPHHGLHHGLQGNLCSGAWSTSTPPSSLTLVSAELFLSHTLTPLLWLPFHSSFFPLLKYVIPEALPPSLMGSALASGGSILELAAVKAATLL
ncbi:hypothetical protein QYF61_015112 [Mycteria americana]|uniref:Uncharacterized protein n=1 Tax=Mycteria americana TaxID=33587 RepID=A0AAN7NGA0_MYCAM|nr:hypothetical protein QYF61_015112 [Mycteria americana]